MQVVDRSARCWQKCQIAVRSARGKCTGCCVTCVYFEQLMDAVGLQGRWAKLDREHWDGRISSMISCWLERLWSYKGAANMAGLVFLLHLSSNSTKAAPRIVLFLYNQWPPMGQKWASHHSTAYIMFWSPNQFCKFQWNSNIWKFLSMIKICNCLCNVNDNGRII